MSSPNTPLIPFPLEISKFWLEKIFSISKYPIFPSKRSILVRNDQFLPQIFNLKSKMLEFYLLKFEILTRIFEYLVQNFRCEIKTFFVQNRNQFRHFRPLGLFALVINAGYDTLVFYNGTLSRANISFGRTEVQYKYCLFFLLLLKKVTRF